MTTATIVTIPALKELTLEVILVIVSGTARELTLKLILFHCCSSCSFFFLPSFLISFLFPFLLPSLVYCGSFLGCCFDERSKQGKFKIQEKGLTLELILFFGISPCLILFVHLFLLLSFLLSFSFLFPFFLLSFFPCFLPSLVYCGSFLDCCFD